MQNYICKGDTIEVIAAEAIASGDVVVTNGLIGIAVTSAAIGETVAVKIEGVFSLAKDNAAINQGAVVYWNATDKVVTATAGTNAQIGYAYLSAIAADTAVLVKLWPGPAGEAE